MKKKVIGFMNDNNIRLFNLDQINQMQKGDQLTVEGDHLSRKSRVSSGWARKFKTETRENEWIKPVIDYINTYPDYIDFIPTLGTKGIRLLGRAMNEYRYQHPDEEIQIKLKEDWADQVKNIPYEVRFSVTHLIIECEKLKTKDKREILFLFPNLNKINESEVSVDLLSSEDNLRGKLIAHELDKKAIKRFCSYRKFHPIYLEVAHDEYGTHLKATKKNFFQRLLMKMGFTQASMKHVLEYLNEKYSIEEQNKFLKIDDKRARILSKIIEDYRERHQSYSEIIEKIQEALVSDIEDDGPIDRELKDQNLLTEKFYSPKQYFKKYIKGRNISGDGRLQPANSYAESYFKRHSPYTDEDLNEIKESWPEEMRALVTELYLDYDQEPDFDELKEIFPNLKEYGIIFS